MQLQKLRLTLLLTLAVILSACSSGVAPTQPAATMAMEDKAAMTEAMDETMAPEGAMIKGTPEASGDMMTATEAPMEGEMAGKETPAGSVDGEDGMMEAPAWYSASLVDVRSGEAFTIQDFKGKVILVETMAMWCPTCLRQQKEVAALHAALGERDDFISVGLDIDPNEDSPALKEYIEANGFDWVYAISPGEVSQEISKLYGTQFLNPPSAPMLIIDRHGEAHPLPSGVKSAEDLQKALEPFLSESM